MTCAEETDNEILEGETALTGIGHRLECAELMPQHRHGHHVLRPGWANGSDLT